MRWTVALLIVLAGCATTPPPAAAPSAAQRQQLQQLDRALAGGIITRDQYDAQRRRILGVR